MERISYRDGPVTLDRPVLAFLVDQEFDDLSDDKQSIMVAILLAESGGVVNITGDNYASGHQTEDSNKRWDDGLGQVNSQHGYERERLLLNPSYNLRACREIYDRQGFNAWVEFNTGRYLEFMEGDDSEAQEAVNAFQVSIASFNALSQRTAVWKMVAYLMGQYSTHADAAINDYRGKGAL